MAERVAEMKRSEEDQQETLVKKDLVVNKDLDASASEFDESEWPEEKNGHG